jgi:hypothetical protein
MVVMVHTASVLVLLQFCSLVSGHYRFEEKYCLYPHGKRRKLENKE